MIPICALLPPATRFTGPASQLIGGREMSRIVGQALSGAVDGFTKRIKGLDFTVRR